MEWKGKEGRGRERRGMDRKGCLMEVELYEESN